MATDKKVCESCRFFRLRVSPLGECYFNPPTIMFDTVASAPRTEYPVVALTTDGCSRWTPSADFQPNP